MHTGLEGLGRNLEAVVCGKGDIQVRRIRLFLMDEIPFLTFFQIHYTSKGDAEFAGEPARVAGIDVDPGPDAGPAAESNLENRLGKPVSFFLKNDFFIKIVKV